MIRRFQSPSERSRREHETYQILAHRVANWHLLLWQVPLFAFTAQAFTFTIALDPDASRVGRLVACGISILISVVSLVTLVRQRKADLLDSGQLNEIEKARGIPKRERLHGKHWARRRTAKPFDWACLDAMVGKWNLTKLWALAFLLLLLIAIGVATLEFLYPATLR